MKKGITPEAAQRLSVFLQKRAQNYQDTEEWSPGDAVEDLLWGSGMKVLQMFSRPVWVIESDVTEAFNNAGEHAMDYFDERFQALIEEMNSAVTAAGFPVPDPSVWEGLRQRYAQKIEDDVVAALKQKMYEAFENTAANVGYAYQEELFQEFKKAAGGNAPGGMVP
jgi:hypothetical protein